MEQLKVFNFEENNVRSVVVESEPYFVGNDVAKVLGYKNGSRDVNRHVDVEDRITQNLPQYQNGTLVSKTTLINESGLYSLIFSSKLESAKRFKRWVTSEVLPQIRQQGIYMSSRVANEIQNNPQVLQMIADRVAGVIHDNQKMGDKLDSLNSKFEGEYVTPQDLVAIKYAINHKSEQVINNHGLQMTLDTIADDPTANIFEQAEAHKKQKEQYQYHLGKIKSRILVMVKKALGLKGNAPNNHIKRKDVDRVIQYVKDLRPGAVN